jgi:predicted permease
MRRWIRQPLFPALAIASVAIAIAVNTAVFALVDAVLFKPLPVKDPSTLYDVCTSRPWPRNMVFYPKDYPEIRRRIDHRAIEDVIAFGYVGGFLADSAAGRRVLGETVSPNYFSALGLVPQVGSFDALSGTRDAATSCVISDPLWSAIFGRDPHVAGRVVTLNGVRLEVAAVAPRDFRGLFAPSTLRTDIWMAIPAAERVPRGKVTLTVRLALRASRTASRPQVTAALKRAISTDLQFDSDDRPYARFKGVPSATPDMDGMLSMGSLVALLGAASVLIAVCANLAILLLTAAVERRPELAMRRALGARQVDVAADVIAEPVLVAIFGGLLGVILARLALVALSAQQPDMEGLRLDIVGALDWRVIGFSVLATALACVGCALVPLRSLSRLSLTTLIGTSETVTRRRGGLLQWTLMSTHVAVTVVLMAVAVHAARTGIEQTGRDVGFDRDLVSFAQVHGDAPTTDMPAAIQSLEDRLARVPGVAAVSHSATLPFAYEAAGGIVRVGNAQVAASIVRVGLGYFETMGIRRLRGRELGPEDQGFIPHAAVISAAAARRWFPNRDPLGQTLHVAGALVSVVGLVSDVDHGFAGGAARPAIYVPFSEFADSAYVLVRGRPAVTLPALRKVLASPPPGVGVARLDSVRNMIDNGVLYPVRASAAVAVLLATIAAATCILGQYAVVARAAVRRRREMAVRRALGAGGRDVLWGLVRRQSVPLAIGTAAGAWALLATRKFLLTFLSGGLRVGPGEAVAAIALVLTISAVACLVASARAMRDAPAMALRQL